MQINVLKVRAEVQASSSLARACAINLTLLRLAHFRRMSVSFAMSPPSLLLVLAVLLSFVCPSEAAKKKKSEDSFDLLIVFCSGQRIMDLSTCKTLKVRRKDNLCLLIEEGSSIIDEESCFSMAFLNTAVKNFKVRWIR